MGAPVAYIPERMAALCHTFAVFDHCRRRSTHTDSLLTLPSTPTWRASTLAAAALYNPLRRRAQRLVDRRFNRARYDAEATLSAFTARLQDAVDLVTVHDELLRTVDCAVEPSGASLWIRPPSPGRRAT
jgi:hypothetical protein